jgi:hypothetical protein
MAPWNATEGVPYRDTDATISLQRFRMNRIIAAPCVQGGVSGRTRRRIVGWPSLFNAFRSNQLAQESPPSVGQQTATGSCRVADVVQSNDG